MLLNGRIEMAESYHTAIAPLKQQSAIKKKSQIPFQKENGLYFFHNFFIEKPGKGVDKQKAECYLKSIDVSTPLKRVLTELYNRKELIVSGYRIG